MTKEVKMIYRTIAQTGDGLTITAETKHAVTLEQAEKDVEKHVLPKDYQDSLKPYITIPVASENGWKYGHINFCPRCGKYIGEYMGDDSEIVNNNQEFECPECYAHMDIHIIRTTEEMEEDLED